MVRLNVRRELREACHKGKNTREDMNVKRYQPNLIVKVFLLLWKKSVAIAETTVSNDSSKHKQCGHAHNDVKKDAGKEILKKIAQAFYFIQVKVQLVLYDG